MEKPVAFFSITLPELDVRIESALLKVLKEKGISFQPNAPTFAAKEFLTEKEAREFLGNISRSLFYKLKNAEKFGTFFCGEGRCLYAREELIHYIKNNKPGF